MSSQLKQIRKQINTIDERILDLLGERIALSQQALNEKTIQEKNLPKSIFDPLREQRMLDELMQKNSSALSNESIYTIFNAIIKTSRDNQYALAKKQNPFTVAIQGVKGCFCEQALQKYCNEKTLPHYQVNYSVSSNNVLKAIQSNPSHYGIVALNNARGGLVEETIEAFSQNKYLIIDSIILLVRQSLITRAHTRKDAISSIYSHSQALRQCAHFLKESYPRATLHNYSDTALAVSDLQHNKLPENSAVIAHESCVMNADLIVLQKDIHDLKNNETVFLLIKGQ